MLKQPFYVGVDGGASKSKVRVEDARGNCVGQTISGPANIRVSVDQAWQSIHSALQTIFHSLSINYQDHMPYIHMGMGLAGCEIQTAKSAFIDQAPSYARLVVSSDAHAACLGAHAGADGGIIIVGTGTVAYQLCKQEITQIGGWGFPHDDVGGGAWLGLEAMKLTVQYLDGTKKISGLSQAVFTHFNHQADVMIAWANAANSQAFAQLAPLVVQQYQAGDGSAKTLLRQAAASIDALHAALLARSKQIHRTTLPCVLTGGLAPFLQPLLGNETQKYLQACRFSAEQGAIFLVQKKHWRLVSV